jgi:ribonucleoside-triphosphate reductase
MMVRERFRLEEASCTAIRKKAVRFGFGGFGEAVYYRTYSRIKEDGSRETWPDTVIRVIDGVLSVRKNHYVHHGLSWDDDAWQPYALRLAETMFDMKWLPPGRGLWAMGTEYIFERGSAALNNCGAVDTANLADSADWLMDMLMCGVGVGFNTAWRAKNVTIPDKEARKLYVVPDSREGWVASVRLLIESYTAGGPWHRFDYSEIRPAGSPIRGFGGTAAGRAPLQRLHDRLERILDDYCRGLQDRTRTVVDVMNAIGACVVAGNVRRSAEIALGAPDDEIFLSLKDFDRFPERSDIGWISNNTVIVKHPEDLSHLQAVAEGIRHNGEPGVLNLANVQSYGRYGEKRPDRAWLTNPCSEIPLESYELCNLAEVFPARCADEAQVQEALSFAAFYASTVALLPTHREETNAVLTRNRRIGVSISGLADLLDRLGADELTRRLRTGYELVRSVNRMLAEAAGIAPSVRVTTVKPSGTLSQLVGVSPGMHFPPFRYAIRRLRVADASALCEGLKASGVPNEPDRYNANTTVFEFPVDMGETREASSVPAREQLEFLALLQREWSDNMVSCTVSFDPQKEGTQIGALLADFVPRVKSVSFLPHSRRGVYAQMPYEGISKAEYETRRAAMPEIDWRRFGGGDDEATRYCAAEGCGRFTQYG